MKNKFLVAIVASATLALAACDGGIEPKAAKDKESSVTTAGTLDDVKKRGHLNCGINTGLPGFAYTDDKGNWQGFDVAYCQALAAAVLGDPSKVKYKNLTGKTRFPTLASGEIDVLSRNTTWTLQRDVELGFTFLGVNYYDGQGFIGRKSLGVKSAKELDGASVCIQTGTTTELNLADFFRANNIKYEPVDSLSNQLDVSILLTPLDKFSLDLETELTHSNIRDLGVSAKFSIVNRNIFKGAEIFKLSFLSSFFNASQDANKEEQFFNSWEIGADMSLEIPRFVAPFGINKLVPKRMSPRTVFSLGTSIQQNIGLDRETLTALMSYKWQYNAKKTIQLDLLVLKLLILLMKSRILVGNL